MVKKIFFISAVALASLGATAFELSRATTSACPLEGTSTCPIANCPLKGTPQCPYTQSSLPSCCKTDASLQTETLRMFK